MLARLQRIGSNIWFIDELRGPENQSVPPYVKASLTKAFHDAGQRLLPKGPGQAIWALSGYPSLFDDLGDDDAEEAVVAAE